MNERIDFIKGCSYLNEIFKSNKPFAAGKIGINEFKILYCYLNTDYGSTFEDSEHRIKFREKAKNLLYINNGVFPETEEIKISFTNEIIKSLKNIDCIVEWMDSIFVETELLFVRNLLKFEKDTIKNNTNNATIITSKTLEPYYSNIPWTQNLKDKKVLVISPFTESITKQYQKRNLLWEDSKILPEFELKTLKHQLSPALGIPSMYDSWIEMVEDMKRKISCIDFDVALIGTGASSLPLVSHCKEIGKQAIHLGGALQILFGIKGNRWDKHKIIKNFYNENWIRPSGDEIPKGFKKNEDGCYW
jgi:hypothetical protein